MVADRRLNLAPEGVAGELLLGGEGLALGYLARPRLSATVFVPHPFAQVPGERLYRTGDWARIVRDQGRPVLDYMGRFDGQVKLRGFRIELGEIEANLRDLPQIDGVLVRVRKTAAGEGHLAAYVVSHEPISPAELKDHLAHHLPPFMVPSAFIGLTAFPLTANGKIDERRLPEPGAEHSAARAPYAPPTTATEQTLSEAWCELLEVPRLGINDNLFEAGANSLTASRALLRLRDCFRIDLPLRALFEYPTISELAQVIDLALSQELQPVAAEEEYEEEGEI